MCKSSSRAVKSTAWIRSKSGDARMYGEQERRVVNLNNAGDLYLVLCGAAITIQSEWRRHKSRRDVSRKLADYHSRNPNNSRNIEPYSDTCEQQERQQSEECGSNSAVCLQASALSANESVSNFIDENEKHDQHKDNAFDGGFYLKAVSTGQSPFLTYSSDDDDYCAVTAHTVGRSTDVQAASVKRRDYLKHFTQDCFSNNFWCDVTLLVADRVYLTHSVVLRCRSGYFARVFQSHESDSDATKLRRRTYTFQIDTSVSCWDIVQSYLYGYKVFVHFELVDKLYALACLLEISSLSSELLNSAVAEPGGANSCIAAEAAAEAPDNTAQAATGSSSSSPSSRPIHRSTNRNQNNSNGCVSGSTSADDFSASIIASAAQYNATTMAESTTAPSSRTSSSLDCSTSCGDRLLMAPTSSCNSSVIELATWQKQPLQIATDCYKFFKCVVSYYVHRKLDYAQTCRYLSPDHVNYREMSESELRKCISLLKTQMRMCNSDLITHLVDVYLNLARSRSESRQD